MKRLHPETLTAQAGHLIDPLSGGVIPAIQPAATYARDENYALRPPHNEYSRDDNPAYAQVESVIAELESAQQARVFSSGMAAIAALFRTVKRGQRVVVPSRMYFGTLVWLKDFAQKRGVELALFDPLQPDSLPQAVGDQVHLVWLETPANPSWEVTDIERAAALVHQAGGKLAVDSTVATPVLTRPLALGADVVVHSATKYLNGHSDLVAGLVATKTCDALWEAVCFERHHSGAVLGAFEAWLLLRGMRTLFVRVARACDSAMKIARHFEGHPKLERVLYPGLASHPGHDIAKRQMRSGFGGMLSLLVCGGSAQALAVAKRLRVFVPATSLGGVESLVEHRKTVEGPHSPTPDNLLRLSIGLEAPQDLIEDLEQALLGL